MLIGVALSLVALVGLVLLLVMVNTLTNTSMPHQTILEQLDE
jgi:uncharacterized membrane protein